MPFVRNVVAQWQPRNCEPMVDFLDSWAHIIPVWILDNILDQLIFPKLQKEVWHCFDSVSYLCTRAQRLKDCQHGWVACSSSSSLLHSTHFLPLSGGHGLSQGLY